MRLHKKTTADYAEGDLTPMIDMTFQLIAFFMVLINFSEAEQDQRIRLPTSELAVPPDAPFEEPRTLQLLTDGTVLYGGEAVATRGDLSPLRRLLLRDAQLLQRTARGPSIVTMIIRADADYRGGQVRSIIRACQDYGFERFTLRARQREAQL